MKFMGGWTWHDVKRTPTWLVEAGFRRMKAHADAQRQANRKGR